ncbi:MORN repeat-containing protein 1-like isoform X3 [Mercenaria mercenaria]|uniref:MORN repeat-containing protein 1-like isoform X3 n=1 Tax=Mercenaria mercenaria TaxID=6596 RepID=UPI00234EED1C|nr:MORN repeat-containing protein 1-like isoform X3 [Mercenaria mercenaria]
MIGKVLKKSKTMSQIDLDKPIIKPHYYPISKAGILSERNEATKAKVGLMKRNTIANINADKKLKSLKNETIEERNESESVQSKGGNENKNVSKRNKEGIHVDNESLKTDRSKTTQPSSVLKRANTETNLKDIRKHAGVAAEGAGSYEYDNKFFKYEGQWKNGKKHGSGKLVFLDSSFYEGTFQNGEIEGFGTRYFAATGCKYQGQFKKGELHGKGRMIWPDGSIYEGQWVNNKRQGFGMMKSATENCLYKGAYHDNKRQGRGMMIYPLSCLKKLQSKGDKYEGDWEMDMRHGDGDMRYMDGTVYEGQFEDDIFNGEGTMRHCSGLVYHGKWINGNPTVLPSKLVIVNSTGKQPVEIIQGQPFDIQVQCVNDNGEVIEVDSRRELRITAGFKYIKAKKGTALFDLIEEYEEKPMATPYYEVLQYPLTDFIVEEEEPEQDDVEEIREENEDVLDEEQGVHRIAEETEENAALNGTNQSDDMKDNAGKESAMSESQQTEQTPEGTLDRQQSIPETPMSGMTSVTPASMLESSLLLERDSRPLPPPVSNKRSEKGECEWKNIQLAQAPPRFPPFVALDEEERKTRARQNKQENETENESYEVEAKRMNRAAHDERFARIGEYVIMVHDVTNPPFMDKTLEPAFILIKLKKPKREKKPKEVKPKWDTSKHINQGMVRS